MEESKICHRISILEILADRVEIPMNNGKNAAGKICEDPTTLSRQAKNPLSSMDRL
jgi:hypothetical protein